MTREGKIGIAFVALALLSLGVPAVLVWTAHRSTEVVEPAPIATTEASAPDEPAELAAPPRPHLGVTLASVDRRFPGHQGWRWMPGDGRTADGGFHRVMENDITGWIQIEFIGSGAHVERVTAGVQLDTALDEETEMYAKLAVMAMAVQRVAGRTMDDYATWIGRCMRELDSQPLQTFTITRQGVRHTLIFTGMGNSELLVTLSAGAER